MHQYDKDIQKEHYRLQNDEKNAANTADGIDRLFLGRGKIGNALVSSQRGNDHFTAKRIRLRQRAAKAKHASAAAFKLGSDYLITKDTDRAFQWYLRAAVLDHTGAQYNLGLMCLKGEGVSQDAFAGLNWIELAADSGDKGAQDLLERIDPAHM